MVLVEACFAQDNTPISLPIDSTPLALQSHLSYRVDHPQALGPVYNLRHIDDWKPFESAPKGFSKGETVWLRADLNVDSAPQDLLLVIENRLIPQVDLYILQDYVELRSTYSLGATVPMEQRPVHTNSLSQPITFKETGSYSLLLRVPGRDVYRVTTGLYLWNTSSYFTDRHSPQSFHHGWHVGVLSLLGLLHILALFIYRRPLWAYSFTFITSALFIVLFREGGLSVWLGWHDTWWIVKGIWASTIAHYVAAILLARHVLCSEQGSLSPGQCKGFVAVAAINALGIAPLLLADSDGACTIGWALSSIDLTAFSFLLFMGINSLRRRTPGTLGFALAWGVFALSCGITLFGSLYPGLFAPGVSLNLTVTSVIAISIWLYLFAVSETVGKHRELIKAQQHLSGHLAWVSHLTNDVRSSLNGVVGTADLLYGQLRPEQQEYAATIQRSGKRLRHLINNIQDLTVIDSYRTQAENIPFRFDRMLASLKKASASHFKAQYDRGTPICWIGDASRWSHTLDTLLDCSLSTSNLLNIDVSVRSEDYLDDSLAILHLKWTATSATEYSQKLNEYQHIRDAVPGEEGNKAYGLQLALFLCKSFIESQDGSFQVIVAPNNKSLQFDLKWHAKVDTLEQGKIRNDLKQLEQMSIAVVDNADNEFVHFISQELTPEYIHPGDLHDTYDLCLVQGGHIEPRLLEKQIGRLSARHIAVIDMPQKLVNKFPNVVGLDSDIPPCDMMHHLVSKISGRPIQLNYHDLGIQALVVEDDGVCRQIIGKILSNLGVTVQYAVDGLKGLELANGEEFDVIFVDCEIPLLNGIALIEHIRQSKDCPNQQAPLIAVTAHRTTAIADKLYSAGTSDIIHKPVNATTIRDVISRIANSSKMAVTEKDSGTHV